MAIVIFLTEGKTPPDGVAERHVDRTLEFLLTEVASSQHDVGAELRLGFGGDVLDQATGSVLAEQGALLSLIHI